MENNNLLPEQSINSAPQQVAQPVAPSSKKKIPKLLVITLLLVLVGVLGGISFFMNRSTTPPEIVQETISPTEIPTPTSGFPTVWDTYTNTAYGFSFQYPATWQRNGTQLTIPESETSYVTISVSINSDNLPLRDFVFAEALKSAIDEVGEETASASATAHVAGYRDNVYATASAQPSLLYENIPGDIPLTEVFFMNGTTVLSLQFEAIDEKIIQEILSSFTFTQTIQPTN